MQDRYIDHPWFTRDPIVRASILRWWYTCSRKGGPDLPLEIDTLCRAENFQDKDQLFPKKSLEVKVNIFQKKFEQYYSAYLPNFILGDIWAGN
jgi:hypothetical protein